MSLRTAIALASVVVALIVGRHADAQNESTSSTAMPRIVRLELSLCEVFPFDRSALVNVLRVELTTAGVELVDRGGGPIQDVDGAALIFIEVPECGADVQQIEVRLVHVANRQSAATTLEVTQASPSVQARIVALSVAELLRSSWNDLEGDNSARAQDSSGGGDPNLPGFENWQDDSEGEENSEDETARALTESESTIEEESMVEEESSTVRVQNGHTQDVENEPIQREIMGDESDARGERGLGTMLDVLLDVRGFIGYGGAQIGGRVGASLMIGRTPLQLGLDAGGWYGVAFDPLGSVYIISATASISLLWTNRRTDINAGIGPRVELGWGRGAGRPDDDDTVWGESFDAFLSIITLRAVVRFRLVRRILLFIDLQGGYVVSGIEARAADRRAAGIGGPVIALGVGLSIEPSAPHQ